MFNTSMLSILFYPLHWLTRQFISLFFLYYIVIYFITRTSNPIIRLILIQARGNQKHDNEAALIPETNIIILF